MIRASCLTTVALCLLFPPGSIAGQQGADSIPPATTPPRAAVPVLRVGLPASDSFSMTTAGPSLQAAIPIEADSAGSFSVTASSLMGPAGQLIPVDIWLDGGAPGDTLRRDMTIERLAAVNLRLRATLPAPGSYRGSFSITTARSRVTRAYTATWERRARPVMVTGAGAVLVRLEPGGGATIPFVLHDTSGTTVRVYRPTLDELKYVHGGDTTLTVPTGSVIVRRAGTGAATDAEIVLAPNTSVPLEMHFEGGIGGAGTYTGTIRVAGPDFVAFTLPVKLFARRGWLWAAIVILVGVLVAEGIRWARDDVRPRLARREDVYGLLQVLGDLEAAMVRDRALDEDETRVVDHQSQRLNAVYRDPKIGKLADFDAVRADHARRLEILPDWVNRRRAAESIEPPELRRDLRAELHPVRDYLLTPGTADADAAKTARAVLTAFPGKVRDALRDLWIARIDAFGEQVKAERSGHAADDDLLIGIADAVEKRLAEAKTHAQADDLAQAAAAFDTARTRFAELLAAALRLRLAEPRPAWLTDPDWQALVTKVQTRLGEIDAAADPAGRIAVFEAARAAYLGGLAGTLAEAADAKLAANPSDTHRQPLAEAAKHARVAGSRVAIPDPRGAAESLRAAEQAWTRYEEARKAAGVQMSAAGTTAPARPPGHVPAPIGTPALASATIARVTVPASAPRLASGKRSIDLLLSVLAAAVAVILGLQLLWSPDITWGTSADHFTAILWGLGLQQVSNSTFRGLADLFGRVGGTPGDRG